MCRTIISVEMSDTRRFISSRRERGEHKFHNYLYESCGEFWNDTLLSLRIVGIRDTHANRPPKMFSAHLLFAVAVAFSFFSHPKWFVCGWALKKLCIWSGLIRIDSKCSYIMLLHALLWCFPVAAAAVAFCRSHPQEQTTKYRIEKRKQKIWKNQTKNTKLIK